MTWFLFFSRIFLFFQKVSLNYSEFIKVPTFENCNMQMFAFIKLWKCDIFSWIKFWHKESNQLELIIL